jgi:steroid 5-alpha reductase family enzyme
VDESRWLAALFSPEFLTLCGLYTGYMTFLWWLRRPLRNAGLVDFGWPCGLVVIAVYFFLTGTGWPPRRAILCGMYAFCGVRFIFGWFVRNVRDGEDRRWNYWRRYWQDGHGPLGIRSVDANFLMYYHAQTFTTLLVLAAPLALTAREPAEGFYPLELAAVGLWLASFALENVADYQLDQFRQSPEGKSRVCRRGLWAYSRHPNYFFEFLLWVAYALFALPSAGGWIDRTFLLAVPVIAYWFLVYYTGIPLTEQASLDRRGEEFRTYRLEVNRFFPWFPKRSGERAPKPQLEAEPGSLPNQRT